MQIETITMIMLTIEWIAIGLTFEYWRHWRRIIPKLGDKKTIQVGFALAGLLIFIIILWIMWIIQFDKSVRNLFAVSGLMLLILVILCPHLLYVMPHINEEIASLKVNQV